MRHQTFAGGAALALGLVAGAAPAQELAAIQVAGGVYSPLFACAPPADMSRLFIASQNGSGGIPTRADIQILDLHSGVLNTTPFLSIDPVGHENEQGLLGMAFDPGYATNGFFYVDYTNTAGNTVIARYRVSANNPDVADPASATTVLTVAPPFDTHKGGWIAFGPDGYLYVSVGDGGSEGDPYNNAQSTRTLLGKILRIDVSHLPYTIPPSNPFATSLDARPEIWAMGLRNPWRNSFDRATGDLWIADVGQSAWEEINVQRAANHPPFKAVNYGWRCYEGDATNNTEGCSAENTYTFPVHVYGHTSAGECAIVGGYVYRGCAIPSLRGAYFFGDYCNAHVWSFRDIDGVVSQLTDRTNELATGGPINISAITSFGEDGAGELYICSQEGNVFKIIPRCAPNCDGNTVSPRLNVIDFTCFLQKFASRDCYANCDGSSLPPTLNVADFTCFMQKFAVGCP